MFVVFDLRCVTIILVASAVVLVRPAWRRDRSTTALHFILAIRSLHVAFHEPFVPLRTLFCLLTIFFLTYKGTFCQNVACLGLHHVPSTYDPLCQLCQYISFCQPSSTKYCCFTFFRLAICCCFHNKPFFLSNISSSPSVLPDSS